jgi:proteasome maturation protein
MANGGMAKKEIGGSHDVLRFGVNDSVRGDLAPPHPLQATIQSVSASLLPLRSPRPFVKP